MAEGTVEVLGKRTIVWDQRDLKGKLVSDGIYFMKVMEPGQSNRRVKILILR